MEIGEDSTMSAFDEAAFPSDVLGEILIRSGAWSPANHSVSEVEGSIMTSYR